MRFPVITVVFVGLILAVSPRTSFAQEPSPEQLRFFETKIRPLFAEYCYKCHGPQKQKADLRFDSREHFLKANSSRPIAIAGHPEKSLLIRAVRHEDESLKMPEKKLSDRQIADLTHWVKIGMPYPPDRTVVPKEDPRAFWAFQPPREPVVPKVKDTTWARSPLDHFILAKLNEKKLRPSPPADRRVLIRRVTFDLTGLPPTPEEVDAFVNDASADAFARVVDRLLASPHYGERWARHWLDVARYADSNGLDENVAFGNAWRYRDFVVTAFNDDMPYDQFLIEQLAGDLLPTDDSRLRQRRLIATGFLALGPKVLAEVDEKQMEMDIIDEQLDTVGRAMLGLTLGCARCHDHKFDPFPTREYYGLAGIFKSTRTMEHFKKVARWHENALTADAKQLAQASALAELEAAVLKLKQQATKDVRAAAKAGQTLPANLEPLFPAEVQAKLKKMRDEVARLKKEVPELPSAMGVTEGKIADMPVHVRGNHLKLGAIVPRQVPDVLAGKSSPAFTAKSSGRLELARWLVQPDHPLTARVMINRIWRWHFGQGIVRTPDNFGRLGEPPDNPLLLDWLTHRFIENKWSIKAMHRLILLSSTYQMSAAGNKDAAVVDPENRLLWRAPMRRLEAEAIRDAVLAVSGKLDRTMGGSLLHVKNRQYLFDHTLKDATRYDSPRRSLYLPVIRNNLYDVFQLFDFPDPAVPSGDRATTTVAPQALFLMNSPWVTQMCEHLATDLLKNPNLDDAGRLRVLYRRAYGRIPAEQEAARDLALVRDIELALQSRVPDAANRRMRAWASLCQTVMAANEFVYLD